MLFPSSIPCSAQWLQSYSAQPVDSVTETITWTSAVSATGQVIYGTTTSLSNSSTVNTTQSTMHSFTLTSLLDGVTYYWRPRSRDVQSVLVTGAQAQFTTKAILVTVTPATATLLSGQTQHFTAKVAGVSDQSVTWSASAGAIDSTGLFTAPMVTTGTTVMVSAASTVGSMRSGSATVTVNPSSATHSVTLNWTDTDSATFNVYRGQISGGPYAKLATAVPTTGYADLDVLSGQTYYYVVTAINLKGIESTYSKQVQAVIPRR